MPLLCFSIAPRGAAANPPHPSNEGRRTTKHGSAALSAEYRLGNRSALDWIIDQYQVSTDKRAPNGGITSDPNAWGEERNDEEYIVRLVKQVVTVSLETMKIVKGLPGEFSDATGVAQEPD